MTSTVLVNTIRRPIIFTTITNPKVTTVTRRGFVGDRQTRRRKRGKQTRNAIPHTPWHIPRSVFDVTAVFPLESRHDSVKTRVSREKLRKDKKKREERRDSSSHVRIDVWLRSFMRLPEVETGQGNVSGVISATTQHKPASSGLRLASGVVVTCPDLLATHLEVAAAHSPRVLTVVVQVAVVVAAGLYHLD